MYVTFLCLVQIQILYCVNIFQKPLVQIKILYCRSNLFSKKKDNMYLEYMYQLAEVCLYYVEFVQKKTMCYCVV